MTLEEALRSLLASSPEVAALVDTRIYPLVLPQGAALPAVTYQRVSRSPVRDLSGVAYCISRIQYSCWAKQYSEAKAVAEAIRRCLSGAKVVGEVRLIDSVTANVLDLHEGETGLYHVPVDILVIHEGGDASV